MYIHINKTHKYVHEFYILYFYIQLTKKMIKQCNLLLENVRMDSRLSTIFCLVWICAITNCGVLWQRDARYWQYQLRKSKYCSISKTFSNFHGFISLICPLQVSIILQFIIFILFILILLLCYFQKSLFKLIEKCVSIIM